MRYVMMLVGLLMIAMAGLWFFTPVLDQAYARHAPQLAHARSARSVTSQSSPSQSSPVQGSVARPGPSGRPVTTTSSASAIASKNIFDNAMSMINAGTGLLGLWFGWMSYRLQRREVAGKA